MIYGDEIVTTNVMINSIVDDFLKTNELDQ